MSSLPLPCPPFAPPHRDPNLAGKQSLKAVACREDTRVLSLREYEEEEGMTVWGLADVNVNKQGKKKGQGLNRKERDMEWKIPVPALKLVRVHLDI